MATYKASSWRYYGSLPLGLLLGSRDIGQAILESGQAVFITWGRNLEDKVLIGNLDCEFVNCGENVEIILKEGIPLNKTLEYLERKPDGWTSYDERT